MTEILFRYHYEWRGEARWMAVEYVDGVVTVTESDGDVHALTYADGALSGSSLATTHRTAIAGVLAQRLTEHAATLAAFGGL
jgi:hypothetical protein